ncbi:MAG: hypothetical protein MdMp014T_1788 [Treponematales bacterium]
MVIESGAIVTHGGRGGAGIGNGFIGSGGEITILGGVILAKGGGCAAGIGGGESRFEETSGNIYIRGGIVYATSGGDSTGDGGGAGIGGGAWGRAGSIEITGGSGSAKTIFATRLRRGLPGRPRLLGRQYSCGLPVNRLVSRPQWDTRLARLVR